jgi:hypothetical protein
MKATHPIVGLIGGAILVAALSIDARDRGALEEMLAGYRSQTWPSVLGTITADGSQHYELHSKRGTKDIYINAPVYSYVVNETEYSANRLSFGKALAEKDTNKVSGSITPTSPVLIYYDPDAPANAVLIPGLSFGQKLWAGLVFIALTAGFFAMYRGLKWMLLERNPKTESNTKAV